MVALLRHCYSDGIHHKRIAIVGITPPPLGGVSVHVQRVGAKFRRQGNSVYHFDSEPRYRYRLFFFYAMHLAIFLLFRRPDHCYIHTLFLPNGLQELRLVCWLKKLLSFELVVVEHNCRYLYARDDAWKKRLNRLMPAIDSHVFIGNLTAQSFADNGIQPAKKSPIEAAFLPPDATRQKAILATYPKSLFQFLQAHKATMCANAFALKLIDGKDLYGFDLCIAALAQLHAKGAGVGLVLVLAKIEHHTYYAQLKGLIAAHGLAEHVYLLVGQRELWPLLKKVTLFLRPTLSDGASVSVEEALWCGTPVVASDVCMRPTGVHLFRAGDAQHLCVAIERALQSAIVDGYTTTSEQNNQHTTSL